MGRVIPFFLFLVVRGSSDDRHPVTRMAERVVCVQLHLTDPSARRVSGGYFLSYQRTTESNYPSGSGLASVHF